MQCKLIQRIESKRIELGLSIKQLSEKSGVPESTYNNIISGRSQNPSYDRLRILAVSVDLSPVEFMDAMDGVKNTPESESLQKEIGKIATGYDLDYLADTFVRTNEMFAADFRTATQSRNAKFEQALVSKDAQFDKEREAYQATISSLNVQLDKKDSRIHLCIAAIIVCALMAAITFGIMTGMFINNRTLSAQVRDLQEYVAEYHYDSDDNFPKE